MVRCGSLQTLMVLGIAVFAMGMVQVPTAQGQAQPISVTGWNADTILDANMTTRFAVSVDCGNCAYFEATAVGDNDQTEHDDGLPAGMTFTSATGSGAMYALQPAAVDNTLQIFRNQTATLTLNTPAAYSKLYVVAATGNGTSTGAYSGTVHYDDGSTLSFTYNTFDWCNSSGHPEAAISAMGRGCSITDAGNVFNYGACDTGLFETAIATDNTKNIVSIDFQGAPSAQCRISNVYAVSGQ